MKNYNNNQVLSKCIDVLKTYFNINNWQINQPIIIRDLYVLLDKIEGVQTVKTIDITNKTGIELGYSQYSYDIKGNKGWFRIRGYHDGAWLEGYDADYVVYWGA